MKKGQEFIGYVERTDYPNKGIVNIHDEETAKDYKVVVKGALEGQRVRFTISKIRGGKLEGNLQEVVEWSELEKREAPCTHFGLCGGCTYQRLEYRSQVELKAGQVKRLLDNAVNNEYEFMPVVESPTEWHYRNKMEFSFGDEFKDGPLTLGLHKKNSFYDIITAAGCKIVDDDYSSILSETLDLCTRYKLDYYHKMTGKGYLRHLLIRRAATTGEIMVCLVTTSQWDNSLAESVIEEDFLQSFKEHMLELNLNGSIVGILHCINDAPADSVRADKSVILHGKDFFFENLLGLIFRISPFSFFQTNSFGAEALYKTVRDFVGSTQDKVVFDLYSGTGTIAQVLAPVAKKVIGVEIVEEAVEAARENANLNDLKQCEFIAGDVLKVIGDIKDKPDIIVLDPPREGVHQKALARILDYGVDRIIYISCKPTSLMRDLEMIQERGYRLEKARCVDLFPETVHVETVVLMSKVDK